MPRISRLDRNDVSPEIAARYDKVFAQRGNVPNMFRVMAHRPEIFATMQDHFAAVLNTGTISTKLKELIIVRTSQVNETPYCLASHTVLARGLGWSEDQLRHLADWQTRDDFTLAEKAALRLAETVTRNANSLTDEHSAPTTRKARSSSCSVRSGSLITSTASTTLCAWSRPSPVKAVAKPRPRRPQMQSPSTA
jgi:AhpD family alkylhydroperoxidase